VVQPIELSLRDDYVAICLTLLVEQALIMTKFSMGWVENTSISKVICMLNVR
jgi:hypothetical protein